ncbi:MAG TPA: ABC transporter substrate-binding protein [Actinomycetota bacterium]|nr:ABC transporter substrate-binding protein [Actinomycetota bacterium]
MGRLALAALLVVGVLSAAACEEPAPTVATPPNPTSAPASVQAACVAPPAHASPAASSPASNSGDYTVAQSGILLVGTIPGTAPFESLNGGAGATVPVGFDIDLIAEVARRLGLRPEVQPETEATLLADVAHGKTDVAISAIPISRQASAAVDFTSPYFTEDLALTVGVDQSRGFAGVKSLAGKTVGVLKGSYGQTCAQALSGAHPPPDGGFAIKDYTDISQAFTDLSVGRIGAVLTDVPTSRRLVQAVIGLQMVAIYRTSEVYGIAVAKTNPNLRATLNRILADMVTDGIYALIYQRWFQVPPPNQPGSPPAP